MFLYPSADGLKSKIQNLNSQFPLVMDVSCINFFK